MNKTIFLLSAVLFVFATCADGTFLAVQDADTNVDQLINGLFEAVGLPDPTTIAPCLDETTSQNLLNLVGEVLQQAQSGPSAVPEIESEIKSFLASIPAKVTSCLSGNTEIASALSAYDLTGKTMDEIKSKVEAYVLTHLSSVISALKVTDTAFVDGSFDQAGQDAGDLAKAALTVATTILQDASTDLQEMLNGVSDAVNLPHTTTIIPCLDSTTAQNLDSLIGEVLQQATSGSISSISKIEGEVQAFVASIPASVSSCLSGNAEVTALINAYGLSGLTPAQIEEKAEAYVVTHFVSVLKAIDQDDEAFQAGDFEASGDDSGKLLLEILS